MQKQIIGGVTAPDGSFPWLAFIQNSVGPEAYLCTGTVVSPNVILTAGHCAEDASTGSVYPPGGYGIFTDWLHRTDTSSGQVSAVSQVIVYPEYVPATGRGDAALLVLSTPTTAPPILLATASDAGLLTPGTTGAIAGWGETIGGDQTSLPTALQYGTTVVQGSAYCTGTNTQFFDAGTQFCAINSPHDDMGICFGDSGGPLVANDLLGQTGAPTEVGIGIQVANATCDTTLPDLFTRVDAISAWANRVITEVAPAPTPTPTLTPTLTPTPTPTPTPVSTLSSQPPLSGLYLGSTSQGRPITLRAGTSRRNVTAMTISYRQVCQVRHHGLAYSFAPLRRDHGSWQLTDKHGHGFSQRFSDSTGAHYQMNGTFTASGRASGTLKVVSHTRRWGACNSGTVEWQAKWSKGTRRNYHSF